jgi:hypothetical protein
MSFRMALLLAAVIFLVTLLIRLPARLLVSFLPGDITCEDISGTVWQGSCGQLRSNGLSIAGLSWKLHPLALLRATISADLSSADPGNGGTGSVEVQRSGDISITELHASLALPAGSGVLPPGASLVLMLALPSAKVHDSRLVSIAGTVDMKQLHISNPPADLGSYELQFPAGESQSTMNGQLRDLEGPLEVNGQLTLQPSGSYEVNGTVASRASASEDLNKALQLFLGPADTQGRRTFSLAGSL